MKQLLLCFGAGMAGMALMFVIICLLPEIEDAIATIRGRKK